MDAKQVINSMLKEQIACLGKIFAKYQVEDEMVWEIAKSFDLIYEKQKHRLETDHKAGYRTGPWPGKKPHPGLVHLVEKINCE